MVAVPFPPTALGVGSWHSHPGIPSLPSTSQGCFGAELEES